MDFNVTPSRYAESKVLINAQTGQVKSSKIHMYGNDLPGKLELLPSPLLWTCVWIWRSHLNRCHGCRFRAIIQTTLWPSIPVQARPIRVGLHCHPVRTRVRESLYATLVFL